MTPAQWAEWAIRMTPASGRVVCTDGAIINWASIMQMQDQYSILSQTVNNGAAILSKTVAITTEYYYFALSIPTGREFVLFDRTLTLSGEGKFEVDVVVFPDGYTGGDAAYNAALNTTGASTVTSQLLCGVTPVNTGNAIVREQDYIDNGAQQGSGTASANSAREGVVKIYGAGAVATLRVRRLQAVNYTANIRMFGWEHDA